MDLVRLQRAGTGTSFLEELLQVAQAGGTSGAGPGFHSPSAAPSVCRANGQTGRSARSRLSYSASRGRAACGALARIRAAKVDKAVSVEQGGACPFSEIPPYLPSLRQTAAGSAEGLPGRPTAPASLSRQLALLGNAALPRAS